MWGVLKRTVSPVDVGTYLGLSVFGLACALGASFTPGNDLGGLVLLWVVACSFFTATGILFWHRWSFARQFKYLAAHGIFVGWSDAAFKVDVEAFNLISTKLLLKAEATYGPRVYDAVDGACVLFREPTWMQDMGNVVLRRVAGEQDGLLLQVGFRSDLSDSALAHELSHLILDVCANHPTEDEAHTIMHAKGWC